MAKAPIASTLFRFATTRNPQLLTKEERERGFVYFPSAEKGNSHFLDQLDAETDTEGRITYLNNRTATFNNLTTRQIVENVNSDLYNFSLWLMKNKNTVTSEEAASKATGVTQLTTNQLVNLWDNLFYQVVSKKSDAVREAIIQMIVANNFLEKDDSGGTQTLITDDIDLQRLANAYVVIPQNVANNIVSQHNTQRNISSSDQGVLNRELTAFESKQKAAEYKLAIVELNEVIQVNKNVNLGAYDEAQEEYLAAYETAYANATKVTDAQTGEVTFNNLVLPDFDYTANSIFKANYVDGKVSAATLNLFNEAVSIGMETEDDLLKHLKTQRKKHYKTYIESVKKRTNSVFYRGTILRSDNGNLPEFSYAASAISTTEDSSKMLLLLNLATGFDTTKVESQTLNISFDTFGNDTSVSLNVETSTSQTALLTSSSEELTIPSGATSVTLSGTFTLDNGEELEISQEIEIGGNRSYGNATRKVEEDTTVVHHGINKVGVADFRKVEQEVCCYVPGEVSRIENILAKEYKERATRQLLSTETSTETITENEVENLSDTTTSERNELSTEVSAILDQSESQSYGASANVNGKFPGTDITFGADSYFEGASGSSSSNSNSTSQTKAEEITQRALERVVQKVTKKRTSRILREFEENNKHGFDNREGTSHVTGVYRWVDKIYSNKLINYGKRLMYEFNVPEPSRFFKEAIIQQAKLSQAQATLPSDLIAPLPPVAPEEFVKEPNEIDDENYVSLASVYGAVVTPPPPEVKIIGKAFSYSIVNTDSGESDEVAAASEQFEIPEGYYTDSASARWFDSVDSNSQQTIIMVGDKKAATQGTSFQLAPFVETIPISFSQYSNLSGNSSIRIKVKRNNSFYQIWQSETYNAILDAYKTKVKEYEEKVREYNDYLFATFTPTAPAPGETKLQFNPLLNRILEKRELKRLAIQILAKPFNLLTSRNNYKSGSDTIINLSSRFDKQASQAKFFEQCFDWEIMAYTFYPYYYAAGGEWKNLFQQSNGIDNTFQAFLQSGMARAVVPVRPGFEEAVAYYLETGDMWMGNQLAIDRDDDLYLSIAEEVQGTEGVVEKEWETRVPTALTIVQSNSAPLDENGLPCCHNEDETENLAYGTSIMVGKDETTPTP